MLLDCGQFWRLSKQVHNFFIHGYIVSKILFIKLVQKLYKTTNSNLREYVYLFVIIEGPRPVSSVSITEITDTSAKVGWTTYTDSLPNSFKIKYFVTEKETTTTKEKTVLKDSSSYIIKDLEPTTPYVIEVYVVKSSDTSTPKKNGLRTNINIGTNTNILNSFLKVDLQRILGKPQRFAQIVHQI